MVANQLGDLENAQRIINAQAAIVEPVASDPAQLHLVLDSQLHRVLTEELRLDFEATLHHARAHRALVEQYGTVWALFDGAPGRIGFTRSRLWLKAQMNLIRGLLLASGDDCLSEAESLLTALSTHDLRDSDRSRLDNYRLWLAIRQARCDDTLCQTHALLARRSDIFSAQFAARAAADAVLADPSRFRTAAKSVLAILHARSQTYAGHPGDLIWRDIGVLEHCCSGKHKRVTKSLRYSLEISNRLPQSPANLWNRHLTQVHLKVLAGAPAPTEPLPMNAALLEKQALDLIENLDRLRAYRKVSPY